MKKKHVFILVAALTITGICGTLLFIEKRKKKKKSAESKDSYHAYNQTTEIKKKKPSVPISDEFPLRLGSKGPRVERLQIWLMRNFGRTAPVNGIFDEETQKRVIKHLRSKIIGSELYNRYAMSKPVYAEKR